jgi:hypothetical protein
MQQQPQQSQPQPQRTPSYAFTGGREMTQGSPMDQGVGKKSFYGEVMQQGAPMSRVSVSLDIGWKRLVKSVKG